MTTFINSNVWFATNHGKATAAREPFLRVLGATVSELVIESDKLGTFSGEVERPGSMLDALRGKVALARSLTQERFFLVSEGSFTVAGGFGFFAQGIEMLLLHDAEQGVDIVEQHIALRTNYATRSVKNADEFHSFLAQVGFGSHGIVLYPEGLPLRERIRKGITVRSDAEAAFKSCIEESPQLSVMVMSDMRAHLNPTRMASISECCELLVNRLATMCPFCSSGGFGLVASVPGLPCEECGAPTARARAEKHGCPYCGRHEERPRGDGRTYAIASECGVCNP